MAASWSLHVHKIESDGPLAVGTVVPLANEVVVGRGTESDLVVGTPTLSSRHARLTVREDGLWVEPLGSGATYVDRAPISAPTKVGDGAWLQLGGILFRVRARTSRTLLTVDLEAERAWLGGRMLALRPRELRLVRALAERPSTWLAPEDLAQAIWADDPAYANVGYIDKYVSYVRRAMRETMKDDDGLRLAVRDAVSAAAEEGLAPDEVGALARSLVKARKKVGIRLQLAPDQVALVR